MLLDFKFKNFRSFKEQTDFTMIPSSKKAHSEYIIRRKGRSDKDVKALPVSVVYGANASGKSNIMLAMYVLKHIVASGTVSEKKSNGLVRGLSVMPFIHDASYFKPMEFEITFFQNENLYRYGLHVIAGDGKNSENLISREYLYLDGKKLFTRNQASVEMEYKRAKDFDSLKGLPEPFFARLLENLNRNLDPEQLFLAGGFKVNFSRRIYEEIQAWFDKFLVIMNADEIRLLSGELHQNGEDSVLLENENIASIFAYAQFGDQEVKFIEDKENREPVMVSVYPIPLKEDGTRAENWDTQGLVVKSETMESRGTIQLLKLAYPFIETLKRGGVIVLDEMDASLHFEIVVSVIRLFNNLDINRLGAQIIFNTHNPIYLDGELLRHDQIVMVKKDQEEMSSEIYSLVDYELRPEERILKNYLNGKYGALPHMDLEIAFKKILDGEINGQTQGETKEAGAPLYHRL